MASTTIFWIATIGFFLLMIFLGYRVYRSVRKDTGAHQILDFWIASRRYNGWWLAASIAAGWLMLGWIGYGMSMIYNLGLSGIWTLPLPWFILLFVIIWIVPKVRRLPAISLPEAIQKRYGQHTRGIMGLCSIFVFVSWTGAETYMMGHLGAPFLGISETMVMIIVMAVVMIYSFFGGFRTSIITDLIQFFLCAVFMTVLAVVSFIAAKEVAGGSVIHALSAMPTVTYGQGTMFNLMACGIAMPIILLVAYLPGWMIEQDLLLRIQGAKSLKEAKKGSYINFLFIGIFVVLLPTIIAFNAIILFPPGVESSVKAVGADATGIISALILHYFPLWAQVLMFVGILAAQMSTIDTFGNVIALPMAYDIIQPAFMKNTPKEKIALWSRWLSVFALLLGLLYALNSTSLMDVYTLSSGVLTASIAIPAFAIFWKKANRLGVILSASLGFIGNVVFYILEYKIWNHVYNPKWLADTYLGYIIAGIVLSLFGLVIGSFIGKPSTAEQLASVSPQPLEGVEVFEVAKG